MAYKCLDSTLLKSSFGRSELALIGVEGNSIYNDILNEIPNNSIPMDFLKALEGICDTQSIIILNENHNISDHRNTAISMLDVLWQKGFRHIGVEGLSKYDTQLNERGFPMYFVSGFYIREPRFGEFIRRALKMGFKLFPYDDQQSKDRELIQAINIKDYLDTNEVTKVFIYCGFDHLVEGNNHSFPCRSMAGNLNIILNTNVYTISQTEMGLAENLHIALPEPQFVLYDTINHTFLGSIESERDIDLVLFRGNREYEFITDLVSVEATSILPNEVFEEEVLILAYNKDETINPVPVSISYKSLNAEHCCTYIPLLLEKNHEYLVKFYGCSSKNLLFQETYHAAILKE